MKKLMLTLLSVSFLGLVSAQDCEPNQIYADSSNGVYPLPYDSIVSPNGGITECATLGQPYEFVFTIVVGDTFKFGAFKFPLDSIRVTSVDGLPVGLNHACSPSLCSFPSNSFNCAVIYGTPTSANTPGDYDLTIVGEAYINGSPLPLGLNFPDPDLLPGKYTLKLLPDDGTPCGTTDTRESLAGKVSLTSQPNPSSGPVHIDIFSKLFGQFDFKVLDLLGQTVYNSKLELVEGRNQFDFDVSQLSNGMYIINLEGEAGSITHKFTIQH